MFGLAFLQGEEAGENLYSSPVHFLLLYVWPGFSSGVESRREYCYSLHLVTQCLARHYDRGRKQAITFPGSPEVFVRHCYLLQYGQVNFDNCILISIK